MQFVAWPLNFFWVIMTDNKWWLFWAHFNRACLIQPWDTNTTMNSALIWTSALLIWGSQESHLELFQSSYTSQDQLYKQLFESIKCMAQLCHCHHQEGNTNYHLLLREDWSEWSSVDQKKPQKKQVYNELEAAERQVCFVSAWAERSFVCIWWRRVFEF